MSEASVPADPRTTALEWAGIAILATTATMFLGVTLNARGLTNGDWQPFEPAIHPAEVVWVVVAMVLTWRIGRLREASTSAIVALAAVGVVVVLALLAHPGLAAGAQTTRLLSFALAAHLVAVCAPDVVWRRAFFGVAIVTVGIQLVLASLQVSSRQSVGLELLGETPRALTDGVIVRAAGTFPHAYILAWVAVALAAACLILSTRWTARPEALIAFALAIGVVPLTAGRTGLLAALGVVGSAFVVPRLRWRAAWVAIGVTAIAVGVVMTGDAWALRADSASSATGFDELSTDRLTLMAEATDIMLGRPVFGVGLGSYLDGVDDPPPGEEQKLVHNVPLIAGAEGGIAFFVLVAGGLVVLTLVVVMRDRTGLPAIAAIVPFAMLDNVLWTRSSGAFFAGLLVGLAVSWDTRERHDDDPGRVRTSTWSSISSRSPDAGRPAPSSSSGPTSAPG